MKLLVVAPYFYPKIGGMENYAWNISKGLKEKYGWEVVVITSNHIENKYIEETISGIKIYRLPKWFKISNTPINPLWYFTIKKIIQKEKPHIINGHTPVTFISDISALISKFENIPFILTYQNDLIKNDFLSNLLIKIYYATLGNLTGRITRTIIASSKYYVKKSFFLKMFTNKTKVVPPGVDIHFYDSIKVNNTLAKQYTNKKIVLFVGQLDKTHIHKGLNYLIESIPYIKQKIKNAKLIVIGKGDMAKEYKLQAKNHGIESDIEFKENINDKELVEYYKLSNVVVLPSTNDSEGFGIVLIEAGACKIPVIGTKIGGIPYIINHMKTGLLINSRNIKDLNENIIKIFSNNELAQQLGENGYKKVKDNFTWDKQITITYKLFNSL